MQYKNTEPLIVVSNPNSTRSASVEREVVVPLQENGVRFQHVTTRFADGDDNVRDMMDRLPDQARVMSAAGDGTAEQLVNAALRSGKDHTFGFLPYGNFNDMANTHMGKGHTVLDLLEAPEVPLYPMTVEVNGENWRHASAYMTMGLTARIAAGFDSEESRKAMKGASKTERLVRRLSQAVGDYFAYKSQPLPAFRVNGGDVMHDSTDIALANNPVAAGMIRPKEPYFDSPHFGARADLNMGNFLQAASFGTLSLTGRSPLTTMRTMHIAFERAAELPVQTGGEHAYLEGVHDIFVYKDPANKVNVLHSKLT